MANITDPYPNIPDDHLYEKSLNKIKRTLKDKLISLALSINDNKQVIPKFNLQENVDIKNLTLEQLKKFISTSEKFKNEIRKYAPLLLGNTPNTYNVEKCAVCFELMGKQKNNLPCGHWIHYGCLEKTCSSKCPCCRKDILEELPWRIKYDLERAIKRKKEMDQLRRDDPDNTLLLAIMNLDPTGRRRG